MRIFIFHVSADDQMAQKIQEALHHFGLESRLYHAEIPISQSDFGEFQGVWRSLDILCILYSAASVNLAEVLRQKEVLSEDKSRVLVLCKIDSTMLPSTIPVTKYVNFADNFETGMQELLDTVKIRAEVFERQRLEDLRDRTINELSISDLQFFLGWTSGDIMYISSYELTEQRLNVPRELKKLTEIGLVDEFPACRKDVWYDISDDGKAIQVLMGVVKDDSTS